MEKRKHLSKAPITEAVIEFQFANSLVLAIDAIQGVSNLLESDYPTEQVRKTKIIRGVINNSEQITETVDEGIVGFVRSSEDGVKVIQLLQDRFAFSHLAPYASWEDLEKDAFEAWRIFQNKINIKHIKRIGVRFINRIEIDLPMGSFDDYLYNSPVISDTLPQEVSAFNQRVVLPNKEINAIAIINQSMEGADQEKNVVPVILDIDVGKLGNFETSKENIMQLLRSIRKYKNDIFFGYITSKALEKYR